jgi:hypothetical protein
VLKPDGGLHFLEHGQAPTESVRRWQRRLHPIHSRIAGGLLSRPAHRSFDQQRWIEHSRAGDRIWPGATAVQLCVSWSGATCGLKCVQWHRTAPASVALVTKSLLDLCRILFHFTCAVAGPRPEEPSQTVTTAPRHDVHVQMRNRLADDVVDRNEGSLRSEGIN